jgi:hypothetical protein
MHLTRTHYKNQTSGATAANSREAEGWSGEINGKRFAVEISSTAAPEWSFDAEPLDDDESAEVLSAIEDYSEPCSTSYTVRDAEGGESIEIYAENPSEAAQEYVDQCRSGYIRATQETGEEGTIYVTCIVTRGDDEWTERVTFDPEEPYCEAERFDHAWEDVRTCANGGGTAGVMRCQACGIEKHWDNWHTDPNTGHQGLDWVKYVKGEPTPLYWIETLVDGGWIADGIGDNEPRSFEECGEDLAKLCRGDSGPEMADGTYRIAEVSR